VMRAAPSVPMRIVCIAGTLAAEHKLSDAGGGLEAPARCR
jgi:hypothetical protein